MTVVVNEPSRRERNKAATRRRIVAAAVKIFSTRGLDSPTVEEIATAADVGKGTIYNYFQTKEDMVVAFMVDLERDVQTRVARFSALSKPLPEILAAFIKFQFRRKLPHHAFVRVFLTRMFAGDAAVLPYIVEMQQAIDPPLRTLFGALQQRGLMRQDIDIERLILAFKVVHLGLTGAWAVEGPPGRGTERMVDEQMRLWCEGLSPVRASSHLVAPRRRRS
jgi:AcrR family transcriptional regulator